MNTKNIIDADVVATPCLSLLLTDGERWAAIHALNDHIVEIQKRREQFGLPIDVESLQTQYANLMSVMDKLLYQCGKPVSVQSASGMVLMPCELTAENGAKALLAGEFRELIEVPNPDYDPEDHDDDGEPEFVTQAVPVSWTTIKAIYAMAVKHFAERGTNNATT